MSLSNPAVMGELKTMADGDMNLVFKAISLTPERPTGFFWQKAKSVEDVKLKIEELLPQQQDEDPADAPASAAD